MSHGPPGQPPARGFSFRGRDKYVHNDFAHAQKLAEEIGFTEASFQAKGGGLVSLIIKLIILGGHALKWW